jgi:AmmeMemoRadiSam system protein A
MAMGTNSEADTGQLSAGDRSTLLEVARNSIGRSIDGGRQEDPALDAYPLTLAPIRACFVTLESAGELRGCIGTLKARRPLITEVAHMARAAALEDPRFPPVTEPELPRLQISISVLSVAVPVQFGSEAELVGMLRPGVDGLILRDGYRSGTFLPSVWDKLPKPADFLRQLKRKAGLPADHWSAALTVERYTTESFAEGP